MIDVCSDTAFFWMKSPASPTGAIRAALCAQMDRKAEDVLTQDFVVYAANSGS